MPRAPPNNNNSTSTNSSMPGSRRSKRGRASPDRSATAPATAARKIRVEEDAVASSATTVPGLTHSSSLDTRPSSGPSTPVTLHQQSLVGRCSTATADNSSLHNGGDMEEEELLDHFAGIGRSVREMAKDVERQVSLYTYAEDCLNNLIETKQMSEEKVQAVMELQSPEENGVSVLRLNVGGELFTVPIATLIMREENTYFHALMFAQEENTAQLFTDENGFIFIDRDPVTFRYILNYLRGYNHFQMLSEDQLNKVKVDARFFQLYGLQELINDMDQSSYLQFLPGPGVSPERNRLRVMYGVGVIGDGFLVTGRYRVTLQILAADYVGVGIISSACVSLDQEFHKAANSCVYYMSGVFYTNFPHHRKEENLTKIESGDYISVLVDMDKGFAEFTLQNSSKMISIGRARQLRFATTLKLGSCVRIVPEEEAVNLPMLRNRTQEVTGVPLFSHPRLNPTDA